MKIQDAFQTIVDNSHEKSINYAVNYAKTGMHLSKRDLRLQTLYVLNNTTKEGDINVWNIWSTKRKK